MTREVKYYTMQALKVCHISKGEFSQDVLCNGKFKWPLYEGKEVRYNPKIGTQEHWTYTVPEWNIWVRTSRHDYCKKCLERLIKLSAAEPATEAEYLKEKEKQ